MRRLVLIATIVLSACRSLGPDSTLTAAQDQAEGRAESPAEALARGATVDELAADFDRLAAEGGLDQADALGLTLAMRAAALGRVDALAALVERGASLAAVNEKTGATIMHYAAQATQAGDAPARWILEHARSTALAALNVRVPSNGHTVAMEAVFNANSGLIDLLLELEAEGVSVDFATTAVTGWGPRTFAEREKLPFAAKLPPSAVSVEERLAWAAAQDAQWLAAVPEAGGQRAAQARGLELLAAVQSRDLAKVQALLAAGASLNATYGRLGATALNTLPTPGLSAEQRAAVKAFQAELLALGADPNVAETGLMQVAAGFREAVFGYEDLLAPLIAKGLKLDQQGPLNGYTRLIDAALRGKEGVIRTLVEAGADTQLRAFNGLSALAAAETFNGLHPEAPLGDDVLALLR